MKKTYRKRIIIDRLATIFAIVCVVVAIIPLGSILLEVVKNGAAALALEFLWLRRVLLVLEKEG
jgi:phosphate transport system permease protein